MRFNYQKADHKIYVCKFSKKFPSKYIILRIHKQRANSVDVDKVAHDEPPHQDLHHLQIQLFSSLVLKELSLQATGSPLMNMYLTFDS